MTPDQQRFESVLEGISRGSTADIRVLLASLRPGEVAGVLAAIAGSLLPTLLRRLNIDPAIAGGVVLTTITDVTGFFIFLGLASWVYL